MGKYREQQQAELYQPVKLAIKHRTLRNRDFCGPQQAGIGENGGVFIELYGMAGTHLAGIWW